MNAHQLAANLLKFLDMVPDHTAVAALDIARIAVIDRKIAQDQFIIETQQRQE